MRRSHGFYLTLFLIILLHAYATARAAGEAASPETKIKTIKISDSGSSPFWSPDGKEIVYVDKGGIFAISSSGSGKARKIIKGYARVLRWSPDGKHIAYVDRRGLKIVPSDSTSRPILVYPDNDVQMPAWSPDSKWISFYLSQIQGRQGKGVFAVNINTLQLIQLSNTGINPCWNKDGKAVYYFANNGTSNDRGQLLLSDLNKTGEITLAPAGGVCMNFNFDKSIMAFVRKTEDGMSTGIYIVSPLKKDAPYKLLEDGFFPSFSFDDKWLTFFRYYPQTRRTKVFIMPFRYSARSSDSELIEIGDGIYPRWARNRNEIVYEKTGVRGGIYVAKISD